MRLTGDLPSAADVTAARTIASIISTNEKVGVLGAPSLTIIYPSSGLIKLPLPVSHDKG